MPGMDNIKIEILPDGTIKMDTDGVSGPNHANAEEFFSVVAKMAGGKTERKRKAGAAHSHSHAHAHDHHHH